MDDIEFKARMDRFVETIKEKADLIDVIEQASGLHFDGKKRGRFVYCREHDSLAVDPDWGQYTWFSKAGTNGKQYDTGDVFTWLEKQKQMDFWNACLWLADRYGVEVPKGIKKDDPTHAKAVKSRGQMNELALRFFESQLWNNPMALEYARGRGWNDETIKAHRLGFSGGTIDAVKELTGILAMNECNLQDPAAVALVGFRGDVRAWMHNHHITDGSDSWVEHNSIMGMAHYPRLVYPHLWRGRPVYFSGRNLRKDNDRYVGEDAPKEGRPKSHNPPRALVGERARFFNAEFTRGSELCFVVEGQADAITLGQWGFPAVALVGVAADESVAETIKKARVKTVYIALDDDKAGQDALLKVAGVFGPMARLFNWIKPATLQEAENNDD